MAKSAFEKWWDKQKFALKFGLNPGDYALQATWLAALQWALSKRVKNPYATFYNTIDAGYIRAEIEKVRKEGKR
jgi:hypothetical protein